MRRGGLLIAIGALVLVIFLVVALIRPPKPIVRPAEGPSGSQIVTMEQPVLYCPERPVEMPRGAVQILVDSSGSMNGVRTPVISYVRWLEQAISRLRDSALGIDKFRIAQFDKRRGILDSASIHAFEKDFQPRGLTTLHEAIRASAAYDLTFILTDGVDASGSGSGDCATGVDAACVARALREAVHVPKTTAGGSGPGVWIVPLWARHDGPFYTEKPIAVSKFDQTKSLEQLHADLNEAVSISNPRADSEGDLVFDYTGPRGLLLIIIAHSSEVGRSAVAALEERREENDIALRKTPGGASKTSALPAVEIYPGFLPKVTWTGFKEADDVLAKGTIEADLVDNRRIVVDCPHATTNRSEFLLTSKRVESSLKCVEILQAPSFEIGLVAKHPADAEALTSFVPSYRRTSSASGDEYHLQLECGSQESRPCSSNPVQAELVARSRYDRSLRGDGATRSGADALIASLSTLDPVAQPHRIYGLDSLLSMFFSEVSADLQKIRLSDIEFCHRTAATK